MTVIPAGTAIKKLRELEEKFAIVFGNFPGGYEYRCNRCNSYACSAEEYSFRHQMFIPVGVKCIFGCQNRWSLYV